MCRWIAYSGNPCLLEEAIFEPEHSLIDQSLSAHSGATATNGDGFGVGWYGARGTTPGVYRSVQPAWNDENLRSLAGQIESGLFLAHIRAATGTAVQPSNCHPFQHHSWLFVHNGVIRGHRELRRELAFAVAPEFFAEIKGTTDSELMFYLALTFGLAENAHTGIARMAGFVEEVGRRHGVEHPLQMTLGISDGQSLYACRYSSERCSRSLYHSESIESLRDVLPRAARFSPDARAIVSEPLSSLAEVWIEVPEASFITVSGGELVVEDFVPQLPTPPVASGQ